MLGIRRNTEISAVEKASLLAAVRPEYIERLFASIGDPDPPGSAARVAVRPNEYPHLLVLMKIHGVMLHRYMVENRRPDEGDLCDAGQLVYMHDLDWFITNERKTKFLREVFYRVYGNDPRKRIMTYDDLVRAVRGPPVTRSGE